MNATLRAYPVQQIVDAIEKRAEERAAEVSPPLGDATPHYVIGRLQGELENALKVIVATRPRPPLDTSPVCKSALAPISPRRLSRSISARTRAEQPALSKTELRLDL